MKIWPLWNLSIFAHGKTLNQHTTTINFVQQQNIYSQHGMMNLICLMDLILLETSKTNLNLSSKVTKL